MEFNANLDIKGSTDTLIQLIEAAATDTGEEGNARKGVIKFSNGLKVQWDTQPLTANQNAQFALPEAYTEAHYFVFSCMGGSMNTTGNEQETMSWVPSTNTLSNVHLRQITDSAREVTYFSFGKDLV